MTTSVPIQAGFTGGKFGPRMKGRVDLELYKYACEDLRNFYVTVQGAALKRSGTVYVNSAISTSTKSRLIPFVVEDTQSYVIELGAGKMRFYRNEGAVLESAQSFTAAPTAANPVVCTDTGHPFSNGDSVYITGSSMTELNGRFFTVANKTANDYELSGEDGTGRTTGTGGSAAAVYQLDDGVSSDSIPWAEADLFEIQYVQDQDLMYLVHEDYPPHVLTREGDTSWTCVEMTLDYPAFETENTGDTVLDVSNATVGANATITASASLFSASDVGRRITIGDRFEEQNGRWAAGADADKSTRQGGFNSGDQLYYEGRLYAVDSAGGISTFGIVPLAHEDGTENDGSNATFRFLNWGGYGYALITQYANTTSVYATVELEFSNFVVNGTGNSTKWAFSAWDEVNGYPSAVAFYEDRLWMGGTTEEPQTFWGSRTGDFENFRTRPADLDDSGLQFTIKSRKRNKIRWMEGDDVLFIGTGAGEFTVDSGSAAKAITPSNVRVRRRSNYGTAQQAQALAVDSSIVFVRQSADLHELIYDFNTDRYVAPDLTRYAHGTLLPGVSEIAHQPDPFSTVWAVKSDGTVGVLTFEKQEEVLAWGDFVFGGTNTEVESVAVIPHPDGDQDQVWLSVKRTVNGGTVRWLEYMGKPFEQGIDDEDAHFVDGGLIYDGAAATTISGLWHLEGETVDILADGAALPQQEVSDGTVTLDVAASVVHVGLPIPYARLRTLKWEGGAADGTTQGKRQRVVNLVMRVDRTGEGLYYGSDFTTMDFWAIRDADDDMDTYVPFYTGDSPILDMPSGWEQYRQVAIEHRTPTPCTILMIAGKTAVETA